MNDDVQQLLDASRQLLAAIDAGDWKRYTELCDSTLTAFEPEAGGHLVSGLEFHKFYFDNPGATKVSKLSSISSPDVRVLGDAAVVTYVRLVQRFGEAGHSATATEETRVWRRDGNRWVHVHFHRSPPGKIDG